MSLKNNGPPEREIRPTGSTHPYVKTCADDDGELADWARRETGMSVHRCGVCRRPDPRSQSDDDPARPRRSRPLHVPADEPPAALAIDQVAPIIAGAYALGGPFTTQAVVAPGLLLLGRFSVCHWPGPNRASRVRGTSE